MSGSRLDIILHDNFLYSTGTWIHVCRRLGCVFECIGDANSLQLDRVGVVSTRNVMGSTGSTHSPEVEANGVANEPPRLVQVVSVDVVHPRQADEPFHLQLPPAVFTNNIAIANIIDRPMTTTTAWYVRQAVRGVGSRCSLCLGLTLLLRSLDEVEHPDVGTRRVSHEVHLGVSIESHRAGIAGYPSHRLGKVVHLT